MLSRVRLFATLWTAAHQAPLCMGFGGQNTGVGCHFLLQGNLPGSSGIFCTAGRFFNLRAIGEIQEWHIRNSKGCYFCLFRNIISLLSAVKKFTQVTVMLQKVDKAQYHF